MTQESPESATTPFAASTAFTNPAFTQTLALIDAANQADPNQENDQGHARPKELLYSERMTARLLQFAPQASEHLQIAARGQHIERWSSPRSAYPEGRTGYKKWRAELGLYHARRVGELMRDAGYGDTDAERVQYLVQKRGLGRDPETQCLEDVICLVFIEHYLADFATRYAGQPIAGDDTAAAEAAAQAEEKLLDIIRKTWQKMSPQAHAAALQLPLSPALSQVVGKALSPV